MPDTQAPPPLQKSQPSFGKRYRTSIKLIGGILILLLLIPLSMITGVRQQDYALPMGAIALFIVLAVVMYVTRRIDWYARDVN